MKVKLVYKIFKLENQLTMNRFLTLYIITFLFISNTFSQSIKNDEIVSQFNLAINFYNSGNYHQANSVFSRIINAYDLNNRTTASYFFSSKIFVEQQNYSEAEDLITKFLELYPSSRYRDEMRMLYAKLFLMQKDYYSALRELAFLIGRSESKDYIENAKWVAENISINFINSAQLEQLNNSFTAKNVKSFFLLQLGKAYSNEGDLVNAKKSLSEIINNYSDSEEYSEASNYYNKLSDYSNLNSSLTLVGVILPLMKNSAG